MSWWADPSPPSVEVTNSFSLSLSLSLSLATLSLSLSRLGCPASFCNGVIPRQCDDHVGSSESEICPIMYLIGGEPREKDNTKSPYFTFCCLLVVVPSRQPSRLLVLVLFNLVGDSGVELLEMISLQIKSS